MLAIARVDPDMELDHKAQNSTIGRRPGEDRITDKRTAKAEVRVVMTKKYGTYLVAKQRKQEFANRTERDDKAEAQAQERHGPTFDGEEIRRHPPRRCAGDHLWRDGVGYDDDQPEECRGRGRFGRDTRANDDKCGPGARLGKYSTAKVRTQPAGQWERVRLAKRSERG